MLVLALALFLLPATVWSEPDAKPLADTFPSEKFNGLQLTYDVSGVELGQPNDRSGFTVSRSYAGKLTGDKVTVSGLAHADGGWGADLSVVVSADGAKPQTYTARKFPERGLSPDPMNERFSVSVDVPKESARASFRISLEGSYNAGSRAVVVSGTFERASPTPTPTPTVLPGQLTVEADPEILPADGKSQSKVTFTYLEGEKPVAGKVIAVFLQPQKGSVDLTNVTTDGQGQAVVTYTAPKPDEQAPPEVSIVGKLGDKGLEAKTTLQIGVVEVYNLGFYSVTDRGGDHVALGVQVRSKFKDELRDVSVQFYDGKPDAGGKLIGEKSVGNLQPNVEVGTAGRVDAPDKAKLVVWSLGLNATKKTLVVRVVAPSLGDSPAGERTYTINNYGVDFRVDEDAYSFVNFWTPEERLGWLGEAVAYLLAEDTRGPALRVLTYESLLRDMNESTRYPHGFCFGFSNSALSYYLNPDLKPAPGTTYSWKRTDRPVLDNILLHGMWQISRRYGQELAATPGLGLMSKSPTTLTQLRERAIAELTAGRPFTVVMSNEPGPGQRSVVHAVVAYQVVEVEELKGFGLRVYDPNRPYSSIQTGIAASAVVMPAGGSFRYGPYSLATTYPTLNIPPNSKDVFRKVLRDVASLKMDELQNVANPSRMIFIRGQSDKAPPVLQTPDGKRVGYINGQQVSTIPGATVSWLKDNYVDVYVFKLPAGTQFSAETLGRDDFTITVGAASPAPKSGLVPHRSTGFASLDLRAFAAGETQIALFDNVKAPSGARVQLVGTPTQVNLVVAGQAVAPTAQQAVTAASLGASTQPSAPTPSAPSAGPPQKPTWSDPLDGKPDSGAASFSGPQSKSSPASKVAGWEPGSAGQAAKLGSMDAYVGYAGSRLRPDQGSIVLRYKPIPDLAATYAQRHASWTDYGQYKPPQSGFLLDTIGWNAAPKGSFGLVLNPAAEGQLTFGVWDGSRWHYVNWKVPAGWRWDPNRWYEFGVTWGPKGMAILVDGEQKASLPDVVQVNNTIPWFLGQGPWYWPYGPHTLMGSYDEVRVYDTQIGPYAASTSASSAGQSKPEPAGQPTGASAAALDPLPAVYPPFLGGRPLPTGKARVSFGEALIPGFVTQPRQPGTGQPATTASSWVPSPGTSVASGPLGQVLGPPERLPGGSEGRLAGAVRSLDSSNFAEHLPGGPSGTVADAIERLPGGTALLCSLPLVLGAGLLALLLLFLGFVVGRSRRSAGQPALTAPAPAPFAGPVATPGPYVGSAGPPPPMAPPSPTTQAGAPQPPAQPGTAGFCEQCGAPLRAGARFCGNCGAATERT